MSKTLAALTLLAACGGPSANSDAGADAGGNKMFADARWALRGDQSIEHDANDFDGRSGISMACSTAETAGVRDLDFMVACVAGPCGTTSGSIGLHASFAASAQTPLSGCRFTVVEGSATFAADCGGGAPSASIPCQVTGVRFYLDPEVMLPTIEGSVLCSNIVNAADGGDARDVTFVRATGAGMPAQFRITNCRGLDL